MPKKYSNQSVEQLLDLPVLERHVRIDLCHYVVDDVLLVPAQTLAMPQRWPPSGLELVQCTKQVCQTSS
jgi:hypothetical protein